LSSPRTPQNITLLARYGGYLASVSGARVVGILITSTTFPYLVRKLGVEGYGLWSYIIAICAFLDLIADPGFTSYLTQQVAARREQAFDLVPDVLFLRVAMITIAIGVLWVLVSFEPRHDVRQLLRLYGTGALLVNVLSADHLLTALELFHLRASLTILQQALYAAGIFVLVRSPQDLLWLPASLLVSATVSGLVGWFVLRGRGLPWALAFRPQHWKQIVTPSLHYASSTLMSNLYHRSGNLMVRWFLGDYALGLYSAAARLVDILRGFVITGLQVLMPRLAASSRSVREWRRMASWAFAAIAVLSIPLACGLFALSRPLVLWLLGSQYSGAISLVEWMAPYLITASAASLFAGTILFSTGRHRAYLAATGSGAVSGVVLYLILIPAFGLRGAALAFVMAEFVVAATAYWLLPELRDAWKNPALTGSLCAAALMLVSLRVLASYTSQLFVLISASGSIYVLACGWFVRKALFGQRNIQPVT